MHLSDRSNSTPSPAHSTYTSIELSDRSASLSNINLATLASKLAQGFISGHVSASTATWLKSLFPAATRVSLSVLAGGRLFISAENMLQPGYFRACFTDVDDTVAGCALLADRAFHAHMPSSGPSAFEDLQSAHMQQGSDSLTAVPVLERQRRVSTDFIREPLPRSTFGACERQYCSTVSDSQSDASGALSEGSMTHMPVRCGSQRTEPIGALSVALPLHRPLTSMYLQNLTDLAEAISPQLARFCGSKNTAQATSVFCHPEVAESLTDDSWEAYSCGEGTQPVSDVEDLTPEELVDLLLYEEDGGLLKDEYGSQAAQAASSRFLNELSFTTPQLPCV